MADLFLTFRESLFPKQNTVKVQVFFLQFDLFLRQLLDERQGVLEILAKSPLDVSRMQKIGSEFQIPLTEEQCLKNIQTIAGEEQKEVALSHLVQRFG